MIDRAAALREAARAHGFEVAAVGTVAPLARDHEALCRWLDGGRQAGMGYMARDPAMRANPAALLPGALAIVSVAVSYYAEVPPFRDEGRYGRVARYAMGRDYHLVLPPRLLAMARTFAEAIGVPVRARALSDAEPLLERAAAARAGLGFVGKNTNLLLPRRGSWSLLGEVLLDVEIEPSGGRPAVSCGTCTRCLPACPTNAFVGPYDLDAGRCISYLTIEHKGPIPRELRAGLGAWIFGCDVCQDVCPFNRFAQPTAWPELAPEAGPGPRLDLEDMLSIDDDPAFRARFAGTALLRPRRRGLLRNAALVARNVGATHCVPALAARASHDPEPVIRGAALWALAGLDPVRAGALADRARTTDPDASVRAEAEAVLSDPDA